MKVTHDKAGGQRRMNNNQGQHVDQRLHFYEVITDFLTNIIGLSDKIKTKNRNCLFIISNENVINFDFVTNTR